METIRWNGDSVTILDQRVLPHEELYHTYVRYWDVVLAIKEMEIRGAPAIGIAAAMGIALASRNILAEGAKDLKGFKDAVGTAIQHFEKSRPTAVNLFNAAARMKKLLDSGSNAEQISQGMEAEAVAMLREDIESNRAMGRNGSRYLSDGDVVMTHCNAGALATGGYGTALGVIRAAVEENKKIQVYACETRPLLQGARLTSWELHRDGIPVTLITDNMAGYFMKKGVIKKVIVGADRIAANGDTANKIGTYSHAVLAKEHRIPFYVAAPVTTLDPATGTGDDIVIEERSVDEVAFFLSQQIAPEGITIHNPAFDVTPARYITAIITDRGVVEHPEGKGIGELLK
ncbi:MAG: S-methyl-5-thioribose-1-phosphate isomerase [Spirochaetes bacterium]|nr:S-methyl-5-thioribose-1-phosphate isomerase [Spirochaetota bacterium]